MASSHLNTGASRAVNIKDGPHYKSKGAVFMKTVSILLVNSRRISNQKKTDKDKSETNTNKTSTSRRVASKMEDNIGKFNPKILESLKKKTHFSKKELSVLCKIYRKLVTNCYSPTNKGNTSLASTSVISRPHVAADSIDRNIFRELMHSTFDISAEELLMERIFVSWEKGNEGTPLKLEGWIIGLSTFLRGNLKEKAAFCFRIYDLNNDGFVTKDEMFNLLKNSLIKQPQDEDPDESVKDLVEIALKKFDVDKDGKISFHDYLTTVTEEPLLLEAFGQCLPSGSATVSFLTVFQN